jgi:hypothetical protein
LGVVEDPAAFLAAISRVKLFGITVPVLGRTTVCFASTGRRAMTCEAVHMGKIEPSCGSKQSAKEHNPASPPQIIQTPAYQTPDYDSANNVAEDGYAGVVSAIVSGFC